MSEGTGDGGEERRHHDHPYHGSPGQLISNWHDYRAPVGTKLGLAARNLARRLMGRTCCGHPGEPGC